MLRIVNDEQAALDGIAEQAALEGIPRPGTEVWMLAPFAHPDGQRWAFVLSDLAPVQPGDVARLDETWFPVEGD